jgi:hypothetical protein
MGRKVPKG